MNTAGAVLAICLALTGLLGCSGSSDDQDTTTSSKALGLPTLEATQTPDDIDCVWICREPGNQLPSGIGVTQVESVSQEMLDRCAKILPCRGLKHGAR